MIRQIRRIERVANEINRRQRRKRIPRPGPPVGPRLIRGRGLVRRRLRSHAQKLVYLLLAAGLIVLLFKYVVVPFIT